MFGDQLSQARQVARCCAKANLHNTRGLEAEEATIVFRTHGDAEGKGDAVEPELRIHTSNDVLREKLNFQVLPPGQIVNISHGCLFIAG